VISVYMRPVDSMFTESTDGSRRPILKNISYNRITSIGITTP
jgi:hypothetical protein